ncbi:PaaX family transcriptional regulator C-terminal domain-containing protein [Phycicoccus ginsengisoli]
MTTTDLDGGADRGPQPPRALIVTLLGLYVRELGGWISVSGLIRLMAAAGVDEQAVRSALTRLKRRGIVESERRDGVAGYALSRYAGQVLELGDRRIFAPRPESERDWVVVVFSVPESERQRRHTLRARLSWLGFGTVASGVWIAPGHLAQDTREALLAEGLEAYVDLFRAEYLAFGDPADKVSQWWDLDTLEQLYDEFLDAHEPALRRWQAASRSAGAPSAGAPSDAGAPAGPEAFADHLRALTAWRRLPYLDPGLPTDLLPEGWSGTRAAETFFTLHRTLAGPAHDFVTAQAATARPG